MLDGAEGGTTEDLEAGQNLETRFKPQGVCGINLEVHLTASLFCCLLSSTSLALSNKMAPRVGDVA